MRNYESIGHIMGGKRTITSSKRTITKTSWKRLEDVFKISGKEVLKRSWRHLAKRPEDALED